MRCLTLLSLLLYLLLVSCGNSDVAGTTSETDIGIIGSIKDESGAAIEGATVIVYKKDENTLPVPVDTVTTDNQGGYFVEVTSSGVYTLGGVLTNETGTYKVALGEVTVDTAVHIGDTLELGDDVLVAVGGLTGVVTLNSTATPAVLVSVKGTPYATISDESGNYTLTDIPVSDNYTFIFSQVGHKSIETAPFEVIADTVTKTSIEVKLDIDLPKPVISNVVDGAVDLEVPLDLKWNDCGPEVTYTVYYISTSLAIDDTMSTYVGEVESFTLNFDEAGSWEFYIVAENEIGSVTGPTVSFTVK